MGKEQYTNIQPHTVFSTEKPYDDDIFHAPSRKIGPTNTTGSDIDYNMHDYSIQIFTTIKDNHFYAIHSNNILTPIRRKSELSFFGRKHNFNKISNHKHNTEGIYIIQIFTIDMRHEIDYDFIMNHYLSNDKIDIEENILSEIKKTISDVKNNKRRTAHPIKLRLVSFIPEYEIYNYMSIYVENINVVVTCKDPSEMTHPSSGIFNKELQRIAANNTDIKNFFSVEIFDTQKTGKPYYFNYGTRIERIEAQYDNTRHPGAYLTIKKEGIIVRNELLKEEEFESIGLYDDMDKAKYGLDPNNELTRLKLELEKEKIDHERYKMNTEARLTALKYTQEVRMSSLKIRHEKAQHKHKIDLSDIEHRRVIDKFNMEMEKRNQNEVFNNFTKGTDITIKLINTMIGVYKAFI